MLTIVLSDISVLTEIYVVIGCSSIAIHRLVPRLPGDPVVPGAPEVMAAPTFGQARRSRSRLLHLVKATEPKAWNESATPT
jgi:hypothetical protein